MGKKDLRGHLSVSSIFLETVCLARTVSLILTERKTAWERRPRPANLPGNYEEDVDGRHQEELLGRHRRRRSRRRRNHFSLLHFKRTALPASILSLIHFNTRLS